MAKTIEQLAREKQQRITEAIKKKEKRFNRQELSINISWSINNAVNFLPEKLKGTDEGLEMVKKWYPKFLELYRDWMLENMPMEIRLETEPEMRDEIAGKWKEEKIEEDRIREANEQANLASEEQKEEKIIEQ